MTTTKTKERMFTIETDLVVLDPLCTLYPEEDGTSPLSTIKFEERDAVIAKMRLAATLVDTAVAYEEAGVYRYYVFDAVMLRHLLKELGEWKGFPTLADLIEGIAIADGAATVQLRQSLNDDPLLEDSRLSVQDEIFVMSNLDRLSLHTDMRFRLID